MDRREMGEAVHSVLADVYRDLGRGPDGAAADHLEARLHDAWDRHTARIGARLERLYPGLWGLVGGQWLQALTQFLAHDLPALVARGGTVECEKSVTASLTLSGGGPDLALRGRFDRLLLNATEIVVADYKTGGKPGDNVDMARLLKGARLQMGLYALMAEAGAGAGGGAAPERTGPRVEVEVLGVGPDIEGDLDAARATLDMKKFGAARAGFLETLAVLARLAAAGMFPLNEESDRCKWCRFRRACRRTHPATLERLAANAALRDYARLRLKSTRKPRLADLDGAPAGGEDS
jgi:hypothetical protein